MHILCFLENKLIALILLWYGWGVLGGRWEGVGRALGGRWEGIGRALASGEG